MSSGAPVPFEPAARPEAEAASRNGTAPVPEAEAQVWVSPGVSPRKRLLTGAGLVVVVGVYIAIAVYERGPIWVSTLIGAVFIGCFIWYLRIVAPTPFTLRLDGLGVTREERGGEPVAIPWGELARVKEERFPNGTPISLAFFKRVGAAGVYRAFIVYRDDVPRFDALLAAVQAALPEGVPYRRETVHE